jgi:uncharacterized glyoxalase superfamily protein PhnB
MLRSRADVTQLPIRPKTKLGDRNHQRERGAVSFRNTTPILRIFDEAKAKEFYIQFLGFRIDWEPRFGDNFPLYMQISRDGCVVHLSEHHGDCCPGAAVRIETDELESYQRQLLASGYKFAKPQIEDSPWGTKEMGLKDPFGNRLIFFNQRGA